MAVGSMSIGGMVGKGVCVGVTVVVATGVWVGGMGVAVAVGVEDAGVGRAVGVSLFCVASAKGVAVLG